MLNSVYYNYYDDFGNNTLRIDSLFKDNIVLKLIRKYDSLNRILSFNSYYNHQHGNTTIYDYKHSGMDRYFQTFDGEDSLLLNEGEDEFIDKKLIKNTAFHYFDNSTYIRRYSYNDYNYPTKETLEKNGDERIQIENKYDGELIIERKQYSIDFSKPTVDYKLTVFEYY